MTQVDTLEANQIMALLRMTKYQKKKLNEARKKFPDGLRWTADEFEVTLGVHYETTARWLLRWRAEGILVRVETEGDTRYRYYFPTDQSRLSLQGIFPQYARNTAKT